MNTPPRKKKKKKGTLDAKDNRAACWWSVVDLAYPHQAGGGVERNERTSLTRFLHRQWEIERLRHQFPSTLLFSPCPLFFPPPPSHIWAPWFWACPVNPRSGSGAPGARAQMPRCPAGPTRAGNRAPCAPGRLSFRTFRSGLPYKAEKGLLLKVAWRPTCRYRYLGTYDPCLWVFNFYGLRMLIHGMNNGLRKSL